jgi:hypothetical protein
MTKYYLKFRNAIKKDKNLSLKEGYMLELLYDYYNISVGYAYPSYEVLMSDLKTKRRAKVSKLLKSLANKGYIKITKVGKKNTYKLLKYLFLSQAVDSDGNKPIDGQVHYSEVNESEITEDETKIIDATGFSKKQAKSLLKVAKDKVNKSLNAFNYAHEKGANNLYVYTLWAVNNINKLKKSFKIEENENWNPKTKFDNFEPREYDWGSLEKSLLGW